MLFNSYVFAVFFAVTYGLYLASARRLRVQNLLLLAASCVFYAWWDWRFLGLILLSTGIDYLCARALDRRVEEVQGPAEDGPGPAYRYSPRGRKLLLLISVGSNLGILGFFKYFDFFVSSGAALLNTLGLPLEPRLLHVALPVGISFYTFHTLSYTIDVYRGEMRAVQSPLAFAVFVTFFPQLVAGPILRAKEFLPQAGRPRRLCLDQVYEGGYLILWGLFKKVVIADNLAVLVDGVFGAPALPHGGAVLISIYAFAVQIYCDFSGYSDMARGLAKTMGFEIPLNFNLPYFARNPSDFWKRWHISLSSWLRDYLYVPLGGNRKGLRRTCINLALTMFLGGLWHGAAWTFVLWGIYQGALLIAHKLLQPLLDRVHAAVPKRWQALADVAVVAAYFQLTCLGWLIFRADAVEQVPRMLGVIFTTFSFAGSGALMVLPYVVPLVLVQLAQYFKDDLQLLLRWPAFARGLAYAAMFYGLILFGEHGERPFIYFQF